MNKSRRIGAIVAMATTAVGVASMVASAPASAATRGPEPVSNWLRPVRAYADNWVDIYWRTDRPVCDVQVRVAARGVDVDYPGHRRFTSFNRGSMLRPGRTDYTSVQINPGFDRPGAALLRAVITYDACGFHARSQSRMFTLTLPVLRNDRPGHDFPGGGHGGPGNGGPGDGGPGGNHGGPGDGGPGGPGNGGPGGNGNGGPDGNGNGNGHGSGGPGGNGHGNGGPGGNGNGNGGPGSHDHGQPGDHHGGPGGHDNQPPTTAPNPTAPAPATTTTPPAPATTTTPPAPATTTTAPSDGGHGGHGHGGTGGNPNGGNGHGGDAGQGDAGPDSPVRRG